MQITFMRLSKRYKNVTFALQNHFCPIICRSGLVVKFVLAMHEPRVRFTAATILLFSRMISFVLQECSLRLIGFYRT
jgi:hypothetical protein